MASNKPSTPKGMRDFTPEQMAKRNYIFDNIKNVFKKYGFVQIETPCVENLDTLTGKYGDEGDKLIFKILNSGNYLSEFKTDEELIEVKNQGEGAFTKKISEKALRYDLTVPFARFVVQHRNEIQLPFRRFQIQPVWRADRPQKGRYREFFQCDADIVGSESLLNETDLMNIFNDVFSTLGLHSFVVKINNRKILEGLAEIVGMSQDFVGFTIVLDKLDKIGEEKVKLELLEKGASKEGLEKIFDLFKIDNQSELLEKLNTILSNNETGKLGITEVSQLFDYMQVAGINMSKFELDISLARGLNYYTGCIFEVKISDLEFGSIAAGGRYDNLCGLFGMDGISGVGISFGADRIYDVMELKGLFPLTVTDRPQIMFVNFGEEEMKYCLSIATELRNAGVSTEIYPDTAKLKKQMQYANDRNIPVVCIVGKDEVTAQTVTLKKMETGEQSTVKRKDLVRSIVN